MGAGKARFRENVAESFAVGAASGETGEKDKEKYHGSYGGGRGGAGHLRVWVDEMEVWCI